VRFVFPTCPSLENSLPELKTILTNSDFVIEGYVDPTEPLRDEGPFGDHTSYYTLPEPYPVFHVTANTHRKDAVYPVTIVGIPPMEDFYIGGASVKLFLPIFKNEFPRHRGLSRRRQKAYSIIPFPCAARRVTRFKPTK